MQNYNNRPSFPKRAVITAGMPYGNKELHFGHVGGVFVQADIFARFLRDRLGAENVIFVSGTDCYGAAIEIGYETEKSNGFNGTIEDYVAGNHDNQAKTLSDYQISLNLFGASALGEGGRIHTVLSAEIFNQLYKEKKLKLESTLQFFDEEKQVFLNGRQVTGRCPIQGCKSEIAYADECSLGHQYSPSELIAPNSILSDKPPVQVPVSNWFIDLPAYQKVMEQAVEDWSKMPCCRKVLTDVIGEFLKKPCIYIKKELIEQVKSLGGIPPFELLEEEQKTSVALIFDNLEGRDKAVAVLSANGIRFRTGKTLVPFRLSGNVKWGVPVPDVKETSGLTFWVWPESLWAPISFTKAVLGDGTEGREWEKWWKSDDAQVYQFIGEDNIYFYGIAEIILFYLLENSIRLPVIVPNHHLLYGKKKASSSGEIKPPKASQLLDYYTPEQLRIHFMNASLSERSIGFEPKPFLFPDREGYDTVLNEGNLLTNVFNRLVRSCFYTVQKYCEGKYPSGTVGKEIRQKSDEVILQYEKFMSELSFDKIFELLNLYVRDANKDWSVRCKSENPADIEQLLIDSFHIIRVMTALLHPIAPAGCDMLCEYLRVDEKIWDWDHIFEPLDFFVQPGHQFLFLEPRVDFYKKHPSQI